MQSPLPTVARLLHVSKSFSSSGKKKNPASKRKEKKKASYLLQYLTSTFHQKGDHPVFMHMSAWHTASYTGHEVCGLSSVEGGLLHLDITQRQESPAPAYPNHKGTVGLAVRGPQKTQSLLCVYRGFIFCTVNGFRSFSSHVSLSAKLVL